MTGRVVSVKLKNTVTVLVERVATHPLYKKTYKQSKRYLVDDQIGVKLGDIVDIQNCKPVSKNKHWKIIKVLGRSFTEIAEEHLKEKAEQAISEVMPEEKESEQVTAGAQLGDEQPEEKTKKEKPLKKTTKKVKEAK